MKRKIAWLGMSWLIVAALVLASCGPAVPGEQEEEEEVVTLSIGETYQSPEVAVTISEAIITDSYEYYDKASESMATKEANPGMSFLIFTAEIINVGSAMRMQEGKRRFEATDSEGNEYLCGEYDGEPRLPTTARFYSDYEMRGAVLFSIPEGASGLKIEYLVVEYPYKKVVEWEIE